MMQVTKQQLQRILREMDSAEVDEATLFQYPLLECKQVSARLGTTAAMGPRELLAKPRIIVTRRGRKTKGRHP